MLDGYGVSHLIKTVMLRELCSVQRLTISRSEIGRMPDYWFPLIWRYINRHGILQEMEGLPLIPIGKDESIREVAIVNRKSLLIYSNGHRTWYHRYSHRDGIVLELLKDLGCCTIESLPSYILQCEAVFVDYILKYTNENLPVLLGNLSFCLGKRELVQRFSKIRSTEAKVALSQELGLFSVGKYLDGQLHQLIKELPMIETTLNQTLISVECCNLVAPKRLPTMIPAMKLLKVRDDYQLSLIQGLGGEQLTEEELIERELLPIIEGKVFFDAVYDAVIEYIFSIISTSRGRCNNIIGRLKQVQFVMSDDGARRKPCELFYPNERLTCLFKGEKGRFPSGKFTERRNLEVLEFLGIKNERDLSAGDVKQSLEAVEHINDFHRRLLKTRSILKVLDERQYLMRDWKLQQTIAITHCIPIQKERPYNYPNSLSWSGKTTLTSVVKLSEVYLREHATLVGCVRTIVDQNFYYENKRVIDVIKQNIQVESNAVIDQLAYVIKEYSSRDKNAFAIVLKDIYRFIQENYTAVEYFKSTALWNKQWVWIGDSFVKRQQIILDECELDLQPYMFKLSEESQGLEPVLRETGATLRLDKQCMVSVLRSMKEAHDRQSQSSRTTQRDREMCREILTHLSQMELSEEETGVIPVPIHSENGELKLVASNEAAYNTHRGHTIMGEESFLLDDSISEHVAKALHIKSYTNKLLAAEPIEMFEDYGQSEPLTNRIKEILKDYGDGSAIFKELIQNADDAGATEVKFLYDERLNEDKRKSLIDPGMRDFQGPALWAFNNAKFSEEDFKNIVKVGGATKEDRRDKIGKFGLGFNAVYNITDVPSFISNGRLVVFDPHTTNLSGVINKKPGVKIALNRLMKYKDQVQIYDGIFGMDASLGNHGTLFRLPLRTELQAQKSEIKSLFYSKVEMIKLLKKFTSEANRLLLFTQNIKSVQVFHLDAKARRADAMEPLLHISKQIFYPKLEACDLRASECTSFNVMSETSKTVTFMQRGVKDQRETDMVLRHAVDIDTTIKPKGIKDFELEATSGKESWFIHSRIDKAECMNLAIRNKKLNPVASIAIPIVKKLGSDEVKTDEAIKGYFFCFLPIPIPNGLHVNINSSFALTRDRRSFQERSHDNKISDTIESTWNRELMSGPVSSAYVGVLKDLTAFFQGMNEESWYRLWPTSGAVDFNRYNQELIKTFYNEIIGKQTAVFLDPCAERTWLNWSSIKIIRDTPAEVQKLMEYVCKLFCQGITIVHLPQEILVTIEEAGFDEELSRISLSFDEFFANTFIPNVANPAIKEEFRDEILHFALKEYSSSNLIFRSIASSECIPTRPFGDLRRPSQLVDDRSKAAELFRSEDAVFPTEIFKTCYEELIRLGMVSDSIKWRMLELRAKTIKDLSATNHEEALKRMQRVLKTMKKNIKRKYDIDSANNISWGDIEFLPVKPKSLSWQYLEWGGEKSSKRFACAKEMYPSRLKNIVGCHKLIVDEELTGEINEKVETLLCICNETTIDDVVKQTEIISKSVTKYNDQNITEDDSKSQMLEGLLPIIFTSIYENLNEKATNDNCQGLEPEARERLEKQQIILTKDCRLARPCQVALTVGFDARPYLFEVGNVARKNIELMKMLNVMETFGLENYVGALKALKDDMESKPLSVMQLRIVRDLLEKIAMKNLKTEGNRSNVERSEWQSEEYSVFLPDNDGVLQQIEKIIVKDVIWMQEESDKKYLHSSVPSQLAVSLGAKTTRSDSILTRSRGLPFGQKEKLTVRLKKILQAYPSEIQILYELLQNADDAGASHVKLVLDKRDHPSKKVFGNAWKSLQGPALLVYNDSPFTECDINAIQSLGESSKLEDSQKIGQFGVGFNVVYHVTDVPCLLTTVENKDTLCIFDPHARFLEECTLEEPGRLFSDGRNYLMQNFPDIYNTFLPKFFTNEKSTVFRLPLRTEEQALQSSIKKRATTTKDIMRMFEIFKAHGPEAIIFLRNVQSVELYVYSTIDQPTPFISIHKKLSKTAIEAKNRLNENCKSLSQNLNDRLNSQREHNPVQYNVDLGYTGKSMKKWTVIQKCTSIHSEDLKQSINREYEARSLQVVPMGGICHANEGNINGKIFCSLPLVVGSSLPVHINGTFILEYESRRRLWFSKEDSFEKDWNYYVIKGCIIPCYFELLKTLGRQIVLKTEKQNIAETLQKIFMKEAKHPKPIETYLRYFPKVNHNESGNEYDAVLLKEFYTQLTIEAVPIMPVVTMQPIRLLVKFCPPKTDTEQFYVPDFSEKDFVVFRYAAQICTALVSIGMRLYNIPDAIKESFSQSGAPLLKLTPSIVTGFLRNKSGEILQGREYLDYKQTVFADTRIVAALLYYCMKKERVEKSRDVTDESPDKADETFDLNGLPLLVTEDGNLRKFDESVHVYFDALSDLFPTKKGLMLHKNLRSCLSAYANKESGPLRRFSQKAFSEMLDNELHKKYSQSEEIEIPAEVLLDLPSEDWLSKVWWFLDRKYKEWQSECEMRESERVTNSKEKPRTLEQMGCTPQHFLKPIAHWCFYPVDRCKLDAERLGAGWHRYLQRRGQASYDVSPKKSSLIRISMASTAVIPETDNVMNALVKEIGLPVPSKRLVMGSGSLLDNLASRMQDIEVLIAALKHENNRMTTGFSHLSMETARDLLYHLQREWRSFKATEKQSLKELPIWKDVSGQLRSISSAKSVYLIRKEIPYDGMERLQRKHNALLLKEDCDLANLYKTIGLKTQCDCLAYCQLILRNFEELQQAERHAHLKFLKSEIANQDELDKDLIETLKETKLIEKNGVLSLVREFYDPNIDLFTETLPETEFPPEPYTTHDWLNFLRRIGLICEVSTTIFRRFAESVSSVENEDDRKRQSKALVDYLLKEDQLKENEEFLTRISTIPFLVAEEVPPQLSEVFPRKLSRSLLCFKGAVKYCDSNLIVTWTVKSILPSYTMGLPCEKFGIDQKVDGITVAKHLVNVTQSELLVDLAKGVKKYPNDVGKLFKKIFETAYQALVESKDKEAISLLVKHPVILVNCDMLSVGKKVSQERDFDIPPYLFSMPPKLEDFVKLFKRLEMSKRPSLQQLSCVLSCIYSNTGGKSLGPNKIKTVLRVVRKLMEITEDEESSTGMKSLHLPGMYTSESSQICLHLSHDLVYFDDTHLMNRLTKLSWPSLYLTGMDYTSRELIKFIKRLPADRRPKILSEFIKEVMMDTDTLPNQGFAEELQNRMSSDQFAECIARLIEHQKLQKGQGDSTSLQEITEGFSRMQVISKRRLQTVLYQSDGVKVESSEADKDVFIEKELENEAVVIYINSSLTDKVKTASIITSAIVRYLGPDFRDASLSPLIMLLLLTDNHGTMHDILNNAGVWKGDLGGEYQGRVPFNPGDFVPVDLHCLLKYDIEDYRNNEYVAYETEDQEDCGPIYVYAKILACISEGDSVGFYRIDLGLAGEKVVPKTKLYGFHRPVSLQADEEEDYEAVDEIKENIRRELEDSFRKGEDNAKRTIKGLWLKWHPDKNGKKEELCTDIFSFIQSETERIRSSNSSHFFSSNFWTADSFRQTSERFCRAYSNQRSCCQSRGFSSSFRRINPQPKEGKRWYRQATVDLEAADSDSRDGKYEWVCFKCHQVSGVSLI